MKTTADEILPLTGLRFVAAFYVFVFHMHLRWPVAETGFLSNVIEQGAVGMSLFFILSGFLLTYRYGDGKGGFREFILKRFARIYPVYLVAALLTLPWLGVSLDSDTAYGLVRQLAAAGALIVIDATLLQAWFPQIFELWNNGGSWSISVEAFCYALLPFILAKATRLDNRDVTILGIASYVLAVIPGLMLVLFYVDQGRAFYSMPIYRLPEFVLGICVAIAALRTTAPSKIVAPLQILGLVVLVAYLGILGPKLPMWITHNWIVLPVIALTIFSVAQSVGLISKILSWRPLVWAGKVSYCFYSFQLFVLLFLKSYHGAIVAYFPALSDNRTLLLASFGVLLLISGIGYHFIEEPARRAIQRRALRPSLPPVLGSAAPV